MTDTTVKSQPPKRGWLRWLVRIGGLLIILIIAAYFVATSSAFIKGIILPRVSASLHADITAGDVSVHPFKEITVRDLKVQAKGREPLVTAPEARLRYSLLQILRGTIHVDEVALISPTVLLVENPDGSSNLDPLLQAPERSPQAGKKPAPPAKPSAPMQIDLVKLTLSNATFRKEKRYRDGRLDLIEVTNLTVTLDRLQNGQPGKLSLGADVQIANELPPPGVGGRLQATLNGGFDFSLGPDLKPNSIKGETRLKVSRAEGLFGGFSGFDAALNCELTPTELKEVALRFQRNGTPLGELRVSGPLDTEKIEGRLSVELRGIDRQLLNLAGAAAGVDFGTTTLNSTNEIQLAKSGALITTTGRIEADKIQATRAGQTTPTLDFGADYDITVDVAAHSAMLRGLNLAGTQNGRPLLSAHLSHPMNLAWGTGANAVGDSELELMVTNLNLSDWKPFLGGAGPAGDVDLNLKLASQQGGNQLVFSLDSHIENLAAAIGGRTIAASVRLQMRGQAADFKQFTLSEYQMDVAQQNQPLITVSGSGTYDLAKNDADVRVALQASLATLVPLLGRPDVSASSGTVDLKGRFTQKQQAQTVTGNLNLAEFTGQFGETRFKTFGTSLDLDVNLTPEQIQINKITGKLTQAGKAGGGFELSGSYDTGGKAARLTARLSDFNQDGLRPFLEPLLADKKLVSIDLLGTVSAQYDPAGHSTVQANLQVTNLVVDDPQSQFPATPLETKLQADVTLQKQTADVREFEITLTPTTRAQNRVQFSGHVDFSRSDAIQGNLKIAADSLDFTRYYDLFAGKKQAAAKTTAPASAGILPANATPQANAEPAPVKLPFQDFTADASIGRFYLHEIEITNWQATVKLDGGHVVLKPFQLTLNGAPVNATADLDLGVPGWKYDVSLNADRVPVLPLANSLVPDANSQYNGFVSAQAQVKGAGVTGVNLKKNLAGGASMSLTNATIQLIASKSKIFFIPINVKFIATLLNIPEIMDSPLTGANVKLNFGNGQIEAQQAEIVSSAFLGNVHGVIPIADRLNDSPLNLPVEVSLTNSLSRKVTLPGDPRNSNTGYIPLPVFVTVTGTIGKPESKKNTVVLAELTLGAAGGLLGGGAGDAVKAGGNVVNALGSLLGANRSAADTNANSNTNPPPSHPSGVNGFLNRILPK